MTVTQVRSQGALLEERLDTAQRLLGAGRDRDGMHWLWAAAAGLDSDPGQIEAVLAVAETARSATKGRIVRSNCGDLIDRLETQLQKLGGVGNASGTARRSEGASVKPSTASVRPGAARRDAYYLDERLSLPESTCRYPTSGLGRESVVEGFFVLAIRRSGYRECLFRFPERDRADARLMLEALNRLSAQAAV